MFIEGESNSPNGDLRQGFSKLLSKALNNNLPRIILGDGKWLTIDKFLHKNIPGDLFLLLVDLDGKEDSRERDIRENNLTDVRDNVFYMIQEMESWFLSQPTILDKFYGVDHNGKKVSDKMTIKKPIDFEYPDKELKKITKTSRKGEYHKIKHAVELLKLLDSNLLEVEFADYKRLVKKLR
ncbi:hypothetical protein DYBT9275_03773 [Dyadobacter sp. CECT 9275]|uniref:DUF4276 family protein n=1 Tax=Dyadobacter helix TaxID=2822344 RepID=A0A916JE22_9BACT|nr:DUF4276 family protein [Dyadobacter sp. CECT 9275]CAG5006256.1 hypothetical protein DYBT9275_03773 [Dyadobacter sp. CECT 9275]